MTLESPHWLQNTATYPARIDRALIAAMWDEGVLGLAAFAVGVRDAGANMSVDISAGAAVIAGDDQANQGNYYASSTAVENRTVAAAPGSGTRTDLVVLRVNDEQAGGPATNDLTLEVITGTVGQPAPAVPATAIALAEIGPIGSGTGAITIGLITDVRPLAGRRTTPGVVELLAGDRVPTGWLECGTEVSRTTYADLFAQVGERYGAGDGSTTFVAGPPLAGRLLTVGTQLDGTGAPGDLAGSDEATLVAANLAAHAHTVPAHAHTVDGHTHSTSNHQHSAPAHTHTMNHDHPSTTSSSAGNHQHILPGQPDQVITRNLSSLPNDPAWEVNEGFVGDSTEFAGTHTHTVNLPNYTGSTGSASGGNTGSAGAGTTGSSSPGPFDVSNPHAVLGVAVIRT